MFVDEELTALTQKLTSVDDDTAVVLKGGTLIDGISEGVLADAAVVISGDTITWVGPTTELQIPADRTYEIVDVAGATIMPGLIDTHVHYLGDLNADPYQSYVTQDDGARVFRAARDLAKTLNGGFTTVRDLGHGNPDHAMALKRAINEGVIVGPRILTSRWAISQTGGHGNLHVWPYEWVERYRPRSTFADGPMGCRTAVRRNFGEGADLIKIYTTEGANDVPNFTLEEIQAMTDEAHSRGAKIATHAKAYEGIRNAVLAGVDTIEHGMQDAPPDLLDLMAERGAILIPTYANYYFLANEGEPWGVTPGRAASARRGLNAIDGALRDVKAHGVKIALGTDTGHGGGPGVGKNAKQLELLVQAGLTPMEAIQAGTSVAANALGLEDYVGTIKAGALAELLVVDADPLDDISELQNKSVIRRVYKTRRGLNLSDVTTAR